MMSTPSMISFFSVDASTSCGSTFAGRKFANKFMVLRMASKPVSGRLSRGLASHFGLRVQKEPKRKTKKCRLKASG